MLVSFWIAEELARKYSGHGDSPCNRKQMKRKITPEDTFGGKYGYFQRNPKFVSFFFCLWLEVFIISKYKYIIYITDTCCLYILCICLACEGPNDSS